MTMNTNFPRFVSGEVLWWCVMILMFSIVFIEIFYSAPSGV